MGPELVGFGDKSSELLAFGDTITDFSQQTWLNWALTKLKAPRVYSTEKIQLKMPDNRLAPEEVESLAVYLKSLGGEATPVGYVRRLDTVDKGKAAGSRLVNEFNCRGCHPIGERGGDVRFIIRDPGLIPPDLTGEGAKVQPSWLFQFLKSPQVLRPWMNMQMPDFGFSDSQANTLVNYFMALANESDFFVEVPLGMSEELKKETTWVFNELKCLQCHQLTAGPELKYSDLAPDMALTRYRLRPRWMEDFILYPQYIQAGTKMPTFFPLEDDEDPDSVMTPLPNWLGGDPMAQIRAIRDYLYLLKDQGTLAVENQEPGQGG